VLGTLAIPRISSSVLSWICWTEFHHYIWAIAMALVNDPFHKSCRAQISSSCFICSRFIIHKSVFRILHSYFIFLATSFRVSKAQYAARQWFYCKRMTSYHAGFYIILWTPTLRISSFLAHSLIEVLLIILPSQLTLNHSEWGSLLKFWQRSLMSRHQISMAPSEDVYTAEGRMPLSWVSRSVWEDSS